MGRNHPHDSPMRYIGVGVGAAGPALDGTLLGKDHKAGLLFSPGRRVRFLAGA